MSSMLPPIQVRTVFGREVGNCVRFMLETHHWGLRRVTVHRENGDLTQDFDSKLDENATSAASVLASFSVEELSQTNLSSHVLHSLEEAAAKSGTAKIDAAMLCVEPEARLNKQQLMGIFSKIIHSDSQREGRGRTEQGSGDVGNDNDEDGDGPVRNTLNPPQAYLGPDSRTDARLNPTPPPPRKQRAGASTGADTKQGGVGNRGILRRFSTGEAV
jgi:hypothetical protein